MPLLDLQRRLVEIGRIRLGEKDGNRPVKRDTWRLTSRNRDLLESAQTVYPGELRAWNDQYELLTEATSLRVMVIPGQTLSQYYEMWSGGGCQRRCDGEQTIVPIDGPCLCPASHDERSALAAKGQACKATTRLSVLLPNVPGVGCWRLETHGYYAAVELAATSEIIERATAHGVMLPASLRIEQRESKKNGQTRKFPVPVIDVAASVDEVMQIAGAPERLALPPVGDTSEDAGRAAKAETPALPPSGEPTLTDAERRKMFKAARDKGLSDAQIRGHIWLVTGQDSTAAIPRSKFGELLAAIGTP